MRVFILTLAHPKKLNMLDARTTVPIACLPRDRWYNLIRFFVNF